VNRVLVVLIEIDLVADLHFEVVAVDGNVVELVLQAPAVFAITSSFLHRQARHFGVLEYFLIPFQAALLEDHRHALHAGQHVHAEFDHRSRRDGAEGRLVRERASVVAQADRNRVIDFFSRERRKALRTNGERGCAFAVERELQRLLAGKLEHDIRCSCCVGAASRRERLSCLRRSSRSRCAEGGGRGPSRVGDLEFMPPREAHIQVVTVAAELERVVVQRGPVVHGAAQINQRLAERWLGAVGDGEDRRFGSFHGERHALVAFERVVQIAPAQHERQGGVGLQILSAEVGVFRPAVVRDFERVLARERADELEAVAVIGELKRFGGVPAVEAPAQKEVAFAEGVGAALRVRSAGGRGNS
jgi:hypothetical protein